MKRFLEQIMGVSWEVRCTGWQVRQERNFCLFVIWSTVNQIYGQCCKMVPFFEFKQTNSTSKPSTFMVKSKPIFQPLLCLNPAQSLQFMAVRQLCFIIIMFDGLKNFVNSKFTPADKDFEGRGVLSPDQFVVAGDQLTNFGWKWQKAIKPSKLLPNLGKQYLHCAATSMQRIHKLTKQSIVQSKNKDEWGFVEITGDENAEEVQEQFRKYDIYVSYDEYYFTPRLWIKGNDFNGKPLTSKEIFQDIYSEYQNETVTEENCPFLDCRMLTIHPCKHSEVMKRFIDDSKARGKKIKPHQALIIFLKFMSSVMPTVRYDQALDIEI